MKFKRPDAISELMTKAVKHLPTAVAAFRDLAVADPSDRPKLLEALRDKEQEADDHYVRLLRKVTTTFVTPYDREDLYLMIETLDDVVDELYHTGSLIVGFEMAELPGPIRANAERLIELSQLCARAPDLIKKQKKLEALLFEFSEVENKLDRGYEKALITTLKAGSDPLHAARVKALADSMEVAATRMEAFIRALAITAIKET